MKAEQDCSQEQLNGVQVKSKLRPSPKAVKKTKSRLSPEKIESCSRDHNRQCCLFNDNIWIKELG